MEQRAYDALEVLWDYMHMGMELRKAECIVGFGNLNVQVPRWAAELYCQGWAPKVLFTGGLGRNTDGRWTGSEAERFAQIAIDCGVREEDIILEERSANTAENILFTRRKLEELGMGGGTIIGVHQPFMERRIWAAMKVYWPEADVVITSPQTTIREYIQSVGEQGLPEKGAVEVVVGDLQRMDVYAKKGYQIPQEIPPKVWEAFRVLVALGYTGQLTEA